MSNPCDHVNLMDGTCAMAWAESHEDSGEVITTWDTDQYPVDECGNCGAEDAEFPGDICEGYQPDLAGEYCERCGEYLGYEDEYDDNYEESECRCDD